MSNATKFRTETAAIAAGNGWEMDIEHDDSARIDVFERGGLTATIAYTESDRVSYAHLFEGSTLVDEVAKGTANKLANVREWLMTEEPVAETVVEDEKSPVDMTKAELMAMAVRLDIRGRRSMNKAQLLDAVRNAVAPENAGAGATDVPAISKHLAFLNS